MNPTSAPPVARLFVPCLGVRCDTAVTPNRYTIDGPFYALLPPASGYPFLADELWLFCQLSDATGTHALELQLAFDLGARVRTLRTFNVFMGSDKLAVRHYAVPIRRVPFRRAGVYEFVLRAGSAELARAAFRLEDVT